MRAFRRKMQIVFQDPLQSLNPRRTVAESIERPLLNFGVSRRARTTDVSKSCWISSASIPANPIAILMNTAADNASG